MEEKWVSSRKYFHLKQFFLDFNSRMIFYNTWYRKRGEKKRNTENYYAIFNSIFNKLIIVNGGKVTFFSKILSLETIFSRFQFKDDLLQCWYRKKGEEKKNTKNYYAIFNGIFNKLIIVNGGKLSSRKYFHLEQFFSDSISIQRWFSTTLISKKRWKKKEHKKLLRFSTVYSIN